MTKNQYMVWRVVRALLIAVTSPIWFPVVMLFGLIVAGVTTICEISAELWDDWERDYHYRKEDGK